MKSNEPVLPCGLRHVLRLLLVWVVVACSRPTPSSMPLESSNGAVRAQTGGESSSNAAMRPASPVPVLADDASWGDPNAPVELVAFLDLQCPFCLRVQPTLRALRDKYGVERLHVVFKHLPLAFHQQAHLAARVARAVQEVAGVPAFFRFTELAFLHQTEIDREHMLSWAEEVGAPRSRVEPLVDSQRITARVDQDIGAAQSLGIRGTPSFLVNGLPVSGAQPLEAFTAVVDDELQKASELRDKGTPSPAISALRTQHNFVPPQASDSKPPPPEDRGTVWKVPIGKSAVLGDAGALVTIIEFADYECPFCKRVQTTLRDLRSKYGRDLRIVFKHNPLPFHKRAFPAAMLAMEARAEKGDDAFWHAGELLFDAAPNLSDAELDRIAVELKLDPKRARKAVDGSKYRDVVEQDAALALDFNARGTPHFFINGRRLTGAQPMDAFVSIIEEELARTKEMVAQGVPRTQLYASIMKAARGPQPPEREEVRPPSTSRPARGNPNAPVTIVMFGDLECPFTRRVMPTLDALDRRYPGKLRFVFRNLPLNFHRGARMAAEVALEVRGQGGDSLFWKTVPLIQSELDDEAPLSEEALVRDAVKVGADADRVRAALRDGRHRAAVEEDLKAAADAEIRGTPSFLVNGYFVSGAQPVEMFARVIDLALKEGTRKPAAR